MASEPGALDKRLLATIVLALVGLAMLIAGSVMLGVGVHKANSQPSCPAVPTTTTTTCPSPSPGSGSPSAVFTISFSPNITWDPALANPQSALFLSTSKALSNQIKASLGGSTSKSRAVTTQPSSVVVNMFTQPPYGTGVNFFTTMLFPDGQSTAIQVQDQMDASGWPTAANVNPTSSCSSMTVPPGQSTLPPTTTTTSATPVSTSTTPKTTTTTNKYPSGVYCYAWKNVVKTIFLVDTAVPLYGSLDGKLSQIQSFLTNYETAIGLQNSPSGNWSNVQMQIVAYNGIDGYRSSPSCTDHYCWMDAVANLKSNIINSQGNTVHTLHDGLFAVSSDTFRPSLSTAGSIIILSDGYDMTDGNALYDAQLLQSMQFSISAIVASQNQLIQSQFSLIVSDPSQQYSVSDFGWLGNQVLISTAATWTCGAQFTTPPPPSTHKTAPPLPTTPSTTAPATQSPVIVNNCQLDVTFIVDESQSMLYNGFFTALQLTQTIATRLANMNPLNRFAVITFNTNIVYNSTSYTDLSGLINQLDNIPQIPGQRDFVLAMTEATNLIATQSWYNKQGVRSLVILVTNGAPDPSQVTDTTAASANLRANYSSQLIAVAVNESSMDASTLQQALQYGIRDEHPPTQYVGTTYNLMTTTQVVNATLSGISCKYYCSTDITFVMETSNVDGKQIVEVERNAILNLLMYYSETLGPGSAETSLIYYSAPDNMQKGASGVLYSTVDNYGVASGQLRNFNFNPLGGASDLQLAFNMTKNLIQQDRDGNNQLVVIFSRGVNDNFTTCCGDPTPYATQLRQLASVQGVVIGPYSNKSTLDNLTGSTSVDGNSAIVYDSQNNIDVTNSAINIQNLMIPIVSNYLSQARCSPVPAEYGPCQQFDDVVIAIHSSTADAWPNMINFVAQRVIPSLTGPITSRVQAKSDFVNVVVITYAGQDVTNVIGSFITNSMMSTQQLVNTLTALPWTDSAATASLTRAYEVASTLFHNNRTFASPVVLVVTDTVEDPESALDAAQQLLPTAFIYGMRINAPIGSIVPGQHAGVVVMDSRQLNPNNTRASTEFNNEVSSGICGNFLIYSTPQPPTAPTPAPNPAPAVKARELWPDVTILIDNSFQTTAMFNAQKNFVIKTFLNQFRIGDKYSRFTVMKYSAVFDPVILCRFSDIHSYWDFLGCVNSISYVSTDAHPTYRDVNEAFVYLLNNVFYYNSSADFQPLKENFLYLMTAGSVVNNFGASSNALKGQNLRIVGVDFSGQVDPLVLSALGFDSFSVSNWQDQTTNDLLSQAVIAQSTTRPKPSFTSLFSDFYFIVDQSVTSFNDVSNAKQFVESFVNLLTINSRRSRVSIVPFNDPLHFNLQLSSSAKAVNSFLSTWLNEPATEGTPDLSSAISNVQAQITQNSNRNVFVIYVLGSANVTGTEGGLNLFLTPRVSTMVLAYNPLINYAGTLTSNSTTFNPTNSGALLNWVEATFPVPSEGRNPMNLFFNALLELQEQADSQSFPASQVAADIVIFLDETGMTQADFQNVKNYLIAFTSQFYVSTSDTQFALQAYSEDIIPEAGFHFYQSGNNTNVANMINALTLVETDPQAQADVAGAINEALNFMLVPSAGWREGVETYSIIFSNAFNFYDNSDNTVHAQKIKDVSKVLIMNLNNRQNFYLNNFLNTGYNLIVQSPSALSINGGQGYDLPLDVATLYRQQIYPPLLSINQINADFIFLLDNSNSAFVYENMILFMLKFMAAVNVNSRVGVINYDSRGVNFNQSLTLSPISAATRQTIMGYQSSMDGGPSDLNAAAGYFSVYNQAFGITNRAVYPILLANSPSVLSPLDSSMMNNINVLYFTYAFQFGTNQNEFSYVKQYLGSDYASDYTYVSDISTYSTSSTGAFNDFNLFIQTQYRAWQNSQS